MKYPFDFRNFCRFIFLMIWVSIQMLNRIYIERLLKTLENCKLLIFSIFSSKRSILDSDRHLALVKTGLPLLLLKFYVSNFDSRQESKSSKVELNWTDIDIEYVGLTARIQFYRIQYSRVYITRTYERTYSKMCLSLSLSLISGKTGLPFLNQKITLT